MAITIAIPFYNAEKYLLDSIKSVFAQTYEDWELILIDDGSTDNSLAIARSIKDPRVRVYSDGKNKKLAARLNEVTKLAKYDFIARMDADDLMLPNRLEVQMKCFEENSKLDLVTTGVYSVLNDLTLTGVRGSCFEIPTYNDIISRKVGITHAALMAKKSWYERNFYNERISIAQDLDLWIKSSKNGDLKIKSIKDPLYIYREENNITKDKLLRAYQNERLMIRNYDNVVINKLIFKSYFKSVVVILLAFLGKLELLQKNRSNGNVNENYSKLYSEAINKIQKIKITVYYE